MHNTNDRDSTFHSDKPPSDDWLILARQEATQQFAISRQGLLNMHQWAITTAMALWAVAFAVSASTVIQRPNGPFLSNISAIIFLISFLLTLRIFSRACLELAIQFKWQQIARSIDLYLIHAQMQTEEESRRVQLMDTLRTYYFTDTCPQTVHAILWTNLQAVFMTLFLAEAALIVWSLWDSWSISAAQPLLYGFGVFVLYECVSLARALRLRTRRAK